MRKNVSNIALRLLADLINLMILTILKERKTLITVPKAVKIDIYSNTDPAILKITTTKSNLLNGSAKYCQPNAISLISISVVNIPKNAKLE